MKTLMPKALYAALGAGLAFALAGPAAAATINQGLTLDVLNTVEDQDREAYIDANGDGLLNVGDVFIGFVRLDDFLPKGVSANNQVYGIISNQIIGSDPGGTGDNTILTLGTTTVAGLTLQDLTGSANTAGGMFAIYDTGTPYETNLIEAAGDVGSNVFDLIDYIVAGGDLRLVAGLVSADNYLMVDNGPAFGIGASNSSFPTLPASVTVGSFVGGLDFLYNNTNFTFADAVITVDSLGALHTTQVGIGNGAIRGAAGDGQEAVFGNAPGFTQCTVLDQAGAPTNVACGFVTDADYFVVPNRVPEPGSLALLGAALLGMGYARRRTNKSKA